MALCRAGQHKSYVSQLIFLTPTLGSSFDTLDALWLAVRGPLGHTYQTQFPLRAGFRVLPVISPLADGGRCLGGQEPEMPLTCHVVSHAVQSSAEEGKVGRGEEGNDLGISHGLKGNLLLPSLPGLTLPSSTLLATGLVLAIIVLSQPFWRTLSLSPSLPPPPASTFLLEACVATVFTQLWRSSGPEVFDEWKAALCLHGLSLGDWQPSRCVTLSQPVWLTPPLRTLALVRSVRDSASWLSVTAPWSLFIS